MNFYSLDASDIQKRRRKIPQKHMIQQKEGKNSMKRANKKTLSESHFFFDLNNFFSFQVNSHSFETYDEAVPVSSSA